MRRLIRISRPVSSHPLNGLHMEHALQAECIPVALRYLETGRSSHEVDDPNAAVERVLPGLDLGHLYVGLGRLDSADKTEGSVYVIYVVVDRLRYARDGNVHRVQQTRFRYQLGTPVRAVAADHVLASIVPCGYL